MAVDPCCPKVANLDGAIWKKQQVVRFDVAVHHTDGVGGPQPHARLPNRVDSIGCAHRAFVSNEVREAAHRQLHHNARPVAIHKTVEDPNEVGVLDPHMDLSFSCGSVRATVCKHKKLDGDVGVHTAGTMVTRPPDDPGATAPQWRDKQVSTAFERLSGVGDHVGTEGEPFTQKQGSITRSTWPQKP